MKLLSSGSGLTHSCTCHPSYCLLLYNNTNSYSETGTHCLKGQLFSAVDDRPDLLLSRAEPRVSGRAENEKRRGNRDSGGAERGTERLSWTVHVCGEQVQIQMKTLDQSHSNMCCTK